MSFSEILPLAILGAMVAGMLYMILRAVFSSPRPPQSGLPPETESKRDKGKS